jgi:hypothetical protein
MRGQALGYGVMGLWGYGVMGLWGYGVMGLWGYGVMGLWGYYGVRHWVMGFVCMPIFQTSKNSKMIKFFE